jgi:hypothetical protein
MNNKSNSFFYFSYHMTRSLAVSWSNRHESTTSRPCFSVIVLVLSTVDASSQPMVNNSSPIYIYRKIIVQS